MNKRGRTIQDDTSPGVGKAFIVVRKGGRWTDLLRLSADRIAVIGRASSNQIVIRSHQASRQHAVIRWDDGQWWVRDLNSRNGTKIDGLRVEVAQPLKEGSCIEVAGCAMTFMTNAVDALAASAGSKNDASPNPGASGLTDDQLTLDGIGLDSITHRATRSRFLPDEENLTKRLPENTSDAWQILFGLAYELAKAQSIEDAAFQTLKILSGALPISAGGVFMPARKDSPGNISPTHVPTLVSFLCNDDRSYRAPAEALIQSVVSNQTAIIARNMMDDPELQDADSRGEYSVTTAIVAPILITKHDHADETTPASRVGYLHLYSSDASTNYAPADLDLAMAACGVLGAAIENIKTRAQLARSLRHSRKQVEQLKERLQDAAQIVGNSAEIEQVKSLITRVAKSRSTVLIRGESGVGKELVASAIHQESPRCDGPIVCLNCAALSPTLLESELFGHEKGAFTGATEQKKGKFESADGGTLMLDEIGEMHVDLQAKLLRVLEGHPFERLGGQHPIRVDVRLIAATNRDLAREVKEGRFRADLYYRLNVVEIVVPPLRVRQDDIMVIAEHYVEHFSEKMARRVDGFSPQAAIALKTYSWPGNIRELKNVIERAVVMGTDKVIEVGDLQLPVAESTPARPSENPLDNPHETTTKLEEYSDGSAPPRASNLNVLTLDEIERHHLLQVLRDLGGNKSRAAVALGIERSTLDRKLKRYDIDSSAFKG